jgi:leader peptidase (prepilin peptidase)/N-methyltransferase
MVVPDWIWVIFTFAFGCCIGSFLNVVIYRLPRDKSLVRPPSACPACGKHIRFYDNIPLISYIMLGRKCRYCKAVISPRYFIIELITGLTFTFTYYLFFRSLLRPNIPEFLGGGWLIYLITIILLSALIASSAIDLELWIIPMSICWVATILGIIASGVAPLLIDPKLISGYRLMPYASAGTAALATGAAVGSGISMLLLASGVIKRSYEIPEAGPKNDATKNAGDNATKNDEAGPSQGENASQEEPGPDEPQFNHRIEALREVLFLLPIIACSIFAYWLTNNVPAVRDWWLNFSQRPVAAGLLGSVFGYFVGCGIVWATRIWGTLAFKKEAMGLGDVHLMGAAGAVIGPLLVTVAFFVAPFFGLAWVIFQMFFKKIRQIPYGPFLSLGIFTCIILHNAAWGHFLVLIGQR